MGAALGLGLQEGDVAISLGTSGTVFAVSPRPTSDASGAVAGFADATGRFLPLACTLNATKVTDTMVATPGTRAPTSSSSWRSSARRVRGGVVLLPYFDGERTPNLPDATGVAERPAFRHRSGAARARRVRRCGVRPPRRARRAARCGRPDRRRPSRRRGWRGAFRRVPAADRRPPPAAGRGAGAGRVRRPRRVRAGRRRPHRSRRRHRRARVGAFRRAGARPRCVRRRRGRSRGVPRRPVTHSFPESGATS